MNRSETAAEALLEAVFGPPDKRDPRLEAEYRITIESILLHETDPAERFVNHLWYTIIDQRRDVKDFVIPMMASLMLSGVNPDFIAEHPKEAREIITAVLSAYGHELKYRQEDADRLHVDGYYPRKVGSRTDAIIKTIEAVRVRYGSWQRFKEELLRRRRLYMKNEKLRKKEVSAYPYISEKSFTFFLRDVEPILPDSEIIPVPVDSNVARCIQMTGIMFDEWPPGQDALIEIGLRDQPENLAGIVRRVRAVAEGVAENLEEVPRKTVQLAQTLFLYGAEYCQRCPRTTAEGYRAITCPIQEECMLGRHLRQREIGKLLAGVRGRG